MKNKLIIIVAISLILFNAFALTGCDSISLADYKATKIAELQAYADAKGVGNYCAEGWQAVLKAASDGKKEIENATTTHVVDTKYTDAKNAINAIEEESMGKFSTLQEAYDEGWLTIQDLMSIAYYHGTLSGVDGTFIPTSKNPENLNTEVTNEIRRTFFAIYVEPLVGENDIITVDDVEISVYYETYDDVIAIRMKDNFGSAGLIREVTIAGISFEYNSGNSIIVWKVN